ncbi:MAG: RsmE family RNA methyltransferase [Clostridia bacterium]
MEIRRFFINKNDFDGKIATISGDEFLHATKVLRQKVGFTIIFCIGDGFDYYAEIIEIDKNMLKAKFINKIQNFTGAKCAVTLYQGSLKNNKNDFVVQKAVELGISEVVFFVSKYVAENDISLSRLNKISIEASKQCGRADIVNVRAMTFDEVISCLSKCALMFYELETERKLNEIDFNNADTVDIIIGSEGGFDISEVESARARGAKILSLGKRILRAETASIVATALTMDALGEL